MTFWEYLATHGEDAKQLLGTLLIGLFFVIMAWRN